MEGKFADRAAAIRETIRRSRAHSEHDERDEREMRRAFCLELATRISARNITTPGTSAHDDAQAAAAIARVFEQYLTESDQ